MKKGEGGMKKRKGGMKKDRRRPGKRANLYIKMEKER